MITRDDLNWWLELAPTLEWTFAKTYAESAPHHYVVEGRTPGITHDDMIRAARVIATFGQPAKYYSLTKIYLVSPDGKYRWWTEDHEFTDTTLVNRAGTELLYGVQNAHSTAGEIESIHNGLATSWDADHPIADGEAERVKSLLEGVRGAYPPHALDLGCGTGRVLDLGLVSPDRYAGVDASRAMLNVLLRKHPGIAAIYPVDIHEILATTTFTAGQFDWVFVSSWLDLTDDELAQVAQIARLAIITIDDEDWTVDDVSVPSKLRIIAEGEAMMASG